MEKNWMKENELSPDSLVQMAIQLAYSRLHHKVGCAIYETSHLRKFHHGRTETLRSFSQESKDFTTSMTTHGISSKERTAKLKIAINSHKEYLKRCMDGNGCDRHLLGLRLLQMETGEKPSEIFTDNSYVLSTSFYLSTSNMPATFYYPGFGPVKIEGYGICYGIRDNEIVAIITSRISGKVTSSSRFREAFREAFIDIQETVEEAKRAKL